MTFDEVLPLTLMNAQAPGDWYECYLVALHRHDQREISNEAFNQYPTFLL